MKLTFVKTLNPGSDMEVINFINTYWTLIAALLALIVWLVRLEGKNSANEKAIERVQKQADALEIKHEQLDSKLVQQLAAVREALARIEGALGINNK